MFLKGSGCGREICQKVKFLVFGSLRPRSSKMKGSSCPDLRLEILQLKI